MTSPRIPPRVQALVTQLSGGDRSTALALHAVISTANDNGQTDLNRVAITYRDDYLEDLRAAGWDAQREAGRLSLDEVRRHLVSSVLPRLIAEGVVNVPEGTLDAPDAPIGVNATLWTEIRQARAEVADVIRQTGEHQTPRGPIAAQTPESGIGTITSASAGFSRARRRPRSVRTSLTLSPKT